MPVADDGPALPLRPGSHPARRSVLAPLDGRDRVSMVSERLREAIFLGYLPEGRPLPNESELAAELSVSTKTLREALANLRAEGLIETRRGRSGGSFVQLGVGASKRLANERLARLSISELRDLADYHRAIGGMAAMLAADRADDEQLARIHTPMQLIKTAPTARERGRADSNFHIEISVAAQSERLTRSEVGLQRESRDVLWMHSARTDECIREHAAIYRAISKQDGQTARRLAEQHIERDYEHLRQLRFRLARE